MTRQQAGSKGGRATVARHGPQHMSRIGKAGAAVTWSRYYLAPYGQTQYAMTRRDNNKIVRVIGQAIRMEKVLGG
jgi:hypothetical protein